MCEVLGVVRNKKSFDCFLMISRVSYILNGIMVTVFNNLDTVNSSSAIACHILSVSVWLALYGSFDSLHSGQWCWQIVGHGHLEYLQDALQVFITQCYEN